MCGIAGYIGRITIDQNKIEQTLELMNRRGPDHQDCFTSGFNGVNVLLLHSRLSIIDLDERANQPFTMGTFTLVYNGELYNYLELREELEAYGYKFTTQSDTEVLLRLMLHYGWKGLDKCEGMWAFAMYEKVNGTLVLSRDRFGEKPLYIYQDATGLYFGSEIKFIFSLINRKPSVNYNHIYRYLVNGYKSLYKVEDSFFLGVRQLPAGSVLLRDRTGNQTENRYWQSAFQPDESMTYQDAVEGAREALIRSVKLRLRADVPLAFCMSGGIDSNSLISIAKNVFNYDVHGFTIVNTDARYEEQDMVEHAVAEQGLRHTAIPVDTEQFLPRLRTLIRQHDAPIYTITYYAHWRLMSSVAEHGYRISISGTAADELFTGYYDHHNAYLYEIHQIYRNSSLYEESLEAWNQYIKPIVRNPFLQNPNAFIENPIMRDHIYLNADQFTQYLRQPWYEPFMEHNYCNNLLRNRMLNELFHEATPQILHEDDLNAMYFSIENRSPFLDKQLFEFCNTIPTRHLIQKGAAKAVLRDAMRGIVPDKILDNRRKVGFNAPIFSYLDIQDPEVRDYLLDDSLIFDYVKRDKIETLIGKPNLPNSESKFLFYFLCSKMFLEEFV
jgi:asparagine synthase (glutamine-hydrolysing)